MKMGGGITKKKKRKNSRLRCTVSGRSSRVCGGSQSNKERGNKLRRAPEGGWDEPWLNKKVGWQPGANIVSGVFREALSPSKDTGSVMDCHIIWPYMTGVCKCEKYWN